MRKNKTTTQKTRKRPKHRCSRAILEEAKTIGYVEGYSDGRNDVIDEFIKYKLLVKKWEKEYNKKTKGNYLIKVKS